MAHCAYWLTDILSFDHPATSVRCAGRSPLVQTRRLRIRILQSEKGDKLELAPVWLQQGSLLPLLCWAPSYLLCSVTQWNEKKEKRILCFSILLSSRCHRPSNSALSSCCPTALCGKENWRSTPVCVSLSAGKRTDKALQSVLLVLAHSFPREARLALTTWLKGFWTDHTLLSIHGKPKVALHRQVC